MANTTAQQLVEVNRVIDALMTADAVQSLTTAGVTWTRAQLSELREWRRELRREISAATSSKRKRNVVIFKGG